MVVFTKSTPWKASMQVALICGFIYLAIKRLFVTFCILRRKGLLRPNTGGDSVPPSQRSSNRTPPQSCVFRYPKKFSRMEDSNELSNTSNFGLMERPSFVPQRNSAKTISPPSNMHHHHSASLDDLLAEEQPAWLDDLLSEPTSPQIMKKGHRRSASDTSAYLNSTLMPLTEDDLVKSHYAGPSWIYQNNINRRGDPWQTNSYGNLQTHVPCGPVNRVGNSTSKFPEKHVNKMKEGAPTKNDGPGAKTDSKRIKHQNAHRARLRRLEYISDLERTIQVLQVEGCEMSSAIHYLDQQLLMLSMENRNLKQRMDSLAEIQKLKHVEQQLLEREIKNLQFRRLQQQPQQNQKQTQLVQHNRHNKYRPSATQETDSQFAALAI